MVIKSVTGKAEPCTLVGRVDMPKEVKPIRPTRNPQRIGDRFHRGSESGESRSQKDMAVRLKALTIVDYDAGSVRLPLQREPAKRFSLVSSCDPPPIVIGSVLSISGYGVPASKMLLTFMLQYRDTRIDVSRGQS